MWTLPAFRSGRSGGRCIGWRGRKGSRDHDGAIMDTTMEHDHTAGPGSSRQCGWSGVGATTWAGTQELGRTATGRVLRIIGALVAGKASPPKTGGVADRRAQSGRLVPAQLQPVEYAVHPSRRRAASGGVATAGAERRGAASCARRSRLPRRRRPASPGAAPNRCRACACCGARWCAGSRRPCPRS
jgi:hypothetical protein